MATAGKWSGLKVPLSPQVLSAMEDEIGFPTMTPVQSVVIPLLLSHKDVSVEAVTGSGKTLAFVIPAVEILLRTKLSPSSLGVLVLVPTHELAKQVCGVFRDVLTGVQTRMEGKTGDNIMSKESASNDKKLIFPIQLLIGGGERSPDADVRAIRKNGGTICIGTPGRVLDVMNRMNDFSVRVRGFELLILDEADRLLSLGFSMKLNQILEKLPKQRRTGIFSATQTDALDSLARAGLRNPSRVTLSVSKSAALTNTKSSRQTTPLELENYFIEVPVANQLTFLISFLRDRMVKKEKVVLFVLTCACVDYWTAVFSSLEIFRNNKWNILGFHGQHPHKRRTGTLQQFSSATSACLVATDVASRGLDIPSVDWIVQFDSPQDPATFVHRVGRTARMGVLGRALVVLSPEESDYVELLKVRKCPLEELPMTIWKPPSEREDSSEPATSHSLVLCKDIQALASKDRDIYLKSQKAFVSYVRGYKEHLCKYIFRFKDINLHELASMFGLVHLPSMPELKNANSSSELFVLLDIDVEAIPFLDKNREKQRQQRLVTQSSTVNSAETGGGVKKWRHNTEAWSQRKEEKSKRDERRIKRKRKSAATQRSIHAEMERIDSDDDDDDDILQEYKKMKKMDKKEKKSRFDFSDSEEGDGDGDD